MSDGLSEIPSVPVTPRPASQPISPVSPEGAPKVIETTVQPPSDATTPEQAEEAERIASEAQQAANTPGSDEAAPLGVLADTENPLPAPVEPVPLPAETPIKTEEGIDQQIQPAPKEPEQTLPEASAANKDAPEVVAANEALAKVEERLKNQNQKEIEAKSKKIADESTDRANILADLHQEDLDRLQNKLQQQALLEIARGQNQEQANLIAKEKGYKSVWDMEQQALARMQIIEEEQKLLNKKENGQTLRDKMEIWSKDLDQDKRFPDLKNEDENFRRAIEVAQRSLSLEREKLQFDALDAVINSSNPEQLEALGRMHNMSPEDLKKLVQNKLHGEIVKDKEGNDVKKSGLKEQSDKGKKNEHGKKTKLAKPTFRGAWKQLGAARKVRREARNEIEAIRTGKDKKGKPNRYVGLTEDQKKKLIKEQKEKINNAKKEARLMAKYMLGIIGKRGFWIFLLAAIGIPAAEFFLMSNAIGKFMNVSK